MMKIISKANSLGNSPVLTTEELTLRARDWAEELWRIVPVAQLSDSARLAFKNHASSFPLNAYEIKNAYQQLRAEEVRRVEDASAAERVEIKTDVNCLRCRDTGMEHIYSQSGKFLGCRPGCNHLPLSLWEWIYKQNGRLKEAGEAMMQKARDAGRALTVDEMIAIAGGVGKDMPRPL